MSVAVVPVRSRKPAPSADGAGPDIPRLVAAWLAGDPAAWGRLYELYDQSLRRYLLHLTKRPDVVHDLSIDTWLRAGRHLRTFDPSRPFEPWLRRIGYNLYMDRYSDAKKRGVEEEATDDSARLAEHATPGPDTPQYAGCSATDLHLTMERMPDVQRRVVTLRHGHGQRFIDIGAMLDRNPNTVRSDDHRAMAFLRRELVPAGASKPAPGPVLVV